MKKPVEHVDAIDYRATDRAAFPATCETIFTRNKGCITPAEELICNLISLYQHQETIKPDDLKFYSDDFLESVEMMQSARPVAA